jgi:hypothetical protein
MPSVNGAVVGDSTKPTSADQCKNGGWMTFQDPSSRACGSASATSLISRPTAHTQIACHAVR